MKIFLSLLVAISLVACSGEKVNPDLRPYELNLTNDLGLVNIRLAKNFDKYYSWADTIDQSANAKQYYRIQDINYPAADRDYTTRQPDSTLALTISHAKDVTAAGKSVINTSTLGAMKAMELARHPETKVLREEIITINERPFAILGISHIPAEGGKRVELKAQTVQKDLLLNFTFTHIETNVLDTAFISKSIEMLQTVTFPEKPTK